jgi:hypothetical protein
MLRAQGKTLNQIAATLGIGRSSLIRALAGVSVTAAPRAGYPVVAAAEVAGAVRVDAAEGLDV